MTARGPSDDNFGVLLTKGHFGKRNFGKCKATVNARQENNGAESGEPNEAAPERSKRPRMLEKAEDVIINAARQPMNLKGAAAD